MFNGHISSLKLFSYRHVEAFSYHHVEAILIIVVIKVVHILPAYMENRGSYMRAHIFFLNLLNKLKKRDRMRGLPSILSLFSQ